MRLTHPLPDSARMMAAQLYLEAFWGKFRPILGGAPDQAAAIFAPKLRLDRAVGALCNGALLGVAGWKTGGAGFFDATLADLRAAYGWFGGGWRGLALSLFDREERAGELLMDGICVAAEARGQGVGGALLEAVERQAAALGCGRLRLDVVDTNPRARALYERRGFQPVRTEKLDWLRPIFGFSASTEMIKPVEAP